MNFHKKKSEIYDFPDINSHTNPIFLNIGLPNVRDIVKLQQLTLVYAYFGSSIPKDLQNLFSTNTDIDITNLRLRSANKGLLHIPAIKTVTYGNKSIKYHCSKLWNETFRNVIRMDSNLKHNVNFNEIKSKHHLKSILKKHFFL